MPFAIQLYPCLISQCLQLQDFHNFIFSVWPLNRYTTWSYFSVLLGEFKDVSWMMHSWFFQVKRFFPVCKEFDILSRLASRELSFSAAYEVIYLGLFPPWDCNYMHFWEIVQTKWQGSWKGQHDSLWGITVPFFFVFRITSVEISNLVNQDLYICYIFTMKV